MCVPFKKQSSDARVPLKAYSTSAGSDLYVAESEILKLRERVLIKCQLSFAIPYGFYGKIVGRSGLANVHGILLMIHLMLIIKKLFVLFCLTEILQST